MSQTNGSHDTNTKHIAEDYIEDGDDMYVDTFSYIGFNNNIRSETPSPGFVMSSAGKWSKVKNMKPIIQDNLLLMFNFEEDFDSRGGENEEEHGFEIDISRELNDQIANPVP